MSLEHVRLIRLFVVLVAVGIGASMAAAGGAHDMLAGRWTLNRDRMMQTASGDVRDPGTAGPRGGGGVGRRDGFGGRRGFGGAGGRGGRGADQEQDRDRFQAIATYIRRMIDPSRGLTIVVRDTAVVITDAEGMTQTLETNDKKADERAENGLVKLTRKTRWDRDALVSEIEVDNGPKIERRYEGVPDGRELRVSTRMSGGGRGRGGDRTVTHVYERPEQ